MSAVGRLWRRAPVWRFSLLSAIGLTGLACLVPPALPPLHLPGHAGVDQARFHPQGDAAVADNKGTIDLPPPGPARTGLIGFAGHGLPLPAGNWQTLAMETSTVGVQQLLLDRVVGGRLTGLLLVTGTGLFGGPAGPVDVPPQCAAPDRLAGAIVPETPAQNPLSHECWAIVVADMTFQAGENGIVPIAHGLARLGNAGIAVPKKMLVTQFVRSTDRGWQMTVVMVPDGDGVITPLSAWAGRYQLLLHKAFDGTATAADLTAGAVQLPG